jgi:nucleotide-binding universal stress UspA family protein
MEKSAMRGYQKLLVPVSGKHQLQRASRALEQALQIVREDGEICLLHCLDEVSYLISGDMHKKMVLEDAREADKLLRPLVERVRDAGTACSVHIVEDTPVSAIPKFATEAGCSAVVMFSDGRDILDKLFTGSITERVIQNLAVPLLVVH